jgi:hypothetical protein
MSRAEAVSQVRNLLNTSEEWKNTQLTKEQVRVTYKYIYNSLLIRDMLICGRTDVEQVDGCVISSAECEISLTCHESIPVDEGTDERSLLQRTPDTEIFPQATGTIYHDVLPVQWGTSPGEIGRKLAGEQYTDTEILKLFSNPTEHATSLHEYKIFCFIMSSYQLIHNQPPNIIEYREHMHHLFAGMPLYEKFVSLVNEYNF